MKHFVHFVRRSFWLSNILRASLFCCMLCWGRAGFGQSLQIQSISLDAQGRVRLTLPSTSSAYYRLLSGRDVTRIGGVAAVSLTNVITGLRATNSQMFYRAQSVPLAAPLDSDQDGIDDVWELQRALDPLLAADAARVAPGDTRTWLQVYLDQIPVIAAFATAGSTGTVTSASGSVPLIFNRPFGGAVHVRIGGTAIYGLDYSIPGGTAVSANPFILSFTVPAASTSFSIPVQPVDTPAIFQDKSVTLTLAAGAGGSYQLSQGGPVTHVRVLTESALSSGGLFAGTLLATNAVLLEPQSLRVAIRSDATGQLLAYFDTARAPFFSAPFTLPVVRDAAGLQFQGEITGAFRSNSLPTAGSARWTFSIPRTSTDQTGMMTSQFVLNLIGLTASGRTNTALGSITFAPLN